MLQLQFCLQKTFELWLNQAGKQLEHQLALGWVALHALMRALYTKCRLFTCKGNHHVVEHNGHGIVE